MLRQVLKSKIHRATVTEANVDYIGSITIDSALLEQADLWPGEHVHVWNVTNGERLETYTIAGESGSGVICMNGPAAHRIRVGDVVIVAAFGLSETPIVPEMILVNKRNRFVQFL